MMTKYTEDILSAAADIEEDGINITYKVLTLNKNTTTPWKNVGVSYAEYSTYCVVVENKTKVLMTIVELDGDIKKESGNIDNILSIMIPGNVVFTPTIKDLVVMRSVEYKVVGVEKVDPDNTPILYILELIR